MQFSSEALCLFDFCRTNGLYEELRKEIESKKEIFRLQQAEKEQAGLH